MSFLPIDTSLLRGRFVYLSLLQPDDITFLQKLAQDERIWEYTKTLLINESFDQQFETYINNALDDRFSGGQCSFVIRETASDRILGMTRFYKVEPSHKRLSIGYTWYTPEVWGQVHNKECKLLLLEYAFETLQYQRVEFEVAHQNVRSQQAVEKIGGMKEGMLRKHGLHADGTMRHTFVFSIVDDEWPEKKQKLQEMVVQKVKML
jgi:RimJ/RimL family protein N-acetyltransferase